ncbi:PstS family phosphate ABC transporter substrate-binding protein [Cohnella sp.]|uniref:PstS family phosphate ABC transporter substrate-binding protein n=1 Tax=Cohnella sp. TaxID=1883426 RepID=UPI0035692332
MTAVSLMFGTATYAAGLSGTIDIDGSSTVFPLTEAVAEEFLKTNKDVRVPVGVSGTGGGFKRFCAGETAISNASRPIKASEKKACKEKGISYLEFTVAYDGLSVLVNKSNTFVDKLTVAELNAIFKPDSTVKTWKDVRSSWPNETIKIYSPGADSGTFDYFTEVINGKAQASRNDKQITFSEDDNTLVSGISGDKNAIGYFGYSYYVENKDKLKVVPIDGGKGAITPNAKTIANGTYAPLSRPLFIYVQKKAMSRPEVKAYVKFYLQNASKLSTEIGFIPLSSNWYKTQLKRIK